MELLLPQFEAQQAPDLARKLTGALEVREHRSGVDIIALAGAAAAENILHQIIAARPKTIP